MQFNAFPWKHLFDLTDWPTYANIVRSYVTRHNAKYNNFDKPDIDIELELDHKFSVYDAFLNKVPPDVVGDITNLRYIPKEINQEKLSNSSISLDQLKAGFKASYGLGKAFAQSSEHTKDCGTVQSIPIMLNQLIKYYVEDQLIDTYTNFDARILLFNPMYEHQKTAIKNIINNDLYGIYSGAVSKGIMPADYQIDNNYYTPNDWQLKKLNPALDAICTDNYNRLRRTKRRYAQFQH